MQRYHAANCTSAVNNSAIGGASARDSGRADSSSIGNYSLNSRRPPPLTPYKLKCEKDGLNSRLGPPDFHPPTSNSPEENLTKEYVQFGYKETVDGLKESEEIILSQVHTFSKPVVHKCKEAVRKCLRAINESRALKRKAGQVYGVPLSGSLLCKPGFPEQRSCGEETKKRWIESLSQQHKRLRSLADNIPGYRRKTLFEVLIRNNVPLLRATWFIKVTYLNQVRPSPAAISSGTPDKTQASRCEQWTKDVIEYLQYLLDELLSRNSSFPAQQTRDRSPQMLYTGSMQKNSPASTSLYGEETSLHFKWWYMVRLLQWHHAEGLLFPNLIVDWVLKLLQEKEIFEILQLLLPIVYGVLESIVLSQTYVQSLVAIAVRFIQEPAPGGSDLVDNSRRAYTLSALIEMVRYLVLAAPDTFVASDFFPLPPSVAACGPNDVSYTSKAYENLEKLRSNSAEISAQFQGRGVLSRFEFLSFDYTISTIQRSADDLAKIASAGYPQHNVAKAVQALDKALSDGDIRAAYSYLFEDLCNGAVDEAWITDVSPCLRSSLRWIGAISTSFVCSVFFLIEWATCDFRDFRAGVPKDIKFSGRKDCSQVYLVIQLLKQKILGGEFTARKGKNCRNNFLGVSKPSGSMDAFESPGPLHDIIVCWIDQHEVHKGGAKRLQLLVFELIRSGIFNPIAYVRQLIVSGMIDVIQPAVDPERRMRHHRILKQLPGCFVHETLEEAQLFGGDKLSEAVRTYSNERRLLLRELLVEKGKYWNNLVLSDQKSKKISTSLSSVIFPRACNAKSNSKGPRKHTKSSVDIRELKERISALLQFPGMSCGVETPVRDEFQNSVKRSSGSVYSKMDQPEATPGCEDCRRAKRPKMNDEKSSCYQGNSPIASDEEDNWWIKKGSKTVESSLKVDPQIEITKQVPRGRQKMARKTQSLAQLQAARIEGSQGASTSHVCDNKVSCPHHGPGVEGENQKVVDVFRTSTPVDMVSVGNSLKQLQFVDKRSIAVWLTTAVRQLVEEPQKSSVRVGQFNRGAPVEEKNTIRWKLGADELYSILFLLDISLDLVSAVKFLLWLLPKANSTPSFAVQGGRNLVTVPRNVENNMCEIGEAILVSSLRRYENILLSADLVPEAMTALMNRAASLMSSNGKISGSAALVYTRYILKRYGSLPSVVEWHNNFKATSEKKLLSELDHTRSGNGEYGNPLGVPAGVDNPDDYLRKKISIGGARPSRVGLSMRDVLQRHVEEATHYLKKLIGTGTMKASLAEKNDDGYQVAQQIVVGLMDCIRQTGGAAQEGDPSLVSSAVSAIINSVGLSVARITDFSLGNIYQNHPSGVDSSNIARYILRIHITCLCLLKEALGERQSRVFEIALATESSTALTGVFAPVKGSRGQHQLSPESYDSNANNSTIDMSTHPSEEILDANIRHSMVPKSLGPNSLGGRFGPGKKQAFHRNGRPMFSLSDDRVMADRVLKTHSPDMIFFDVTSLLSVVNDIFKSHVPSIDSSAPKPSLVFKDYADHTSFETFADLIDQISCEIDCKCLHGGESHGMMTSGLHLDSRNTTTFSVLSLVSKYRWDAKLVLVLSALAVKYGVFLLLAETHATNQLTKSLALIKQLPSIFSRQNALHQRLDKTRILMQDMVDLTTTIIDIYQLPPNHITAAFTDHIPTAVYWIVRCVLICVSHISGASGFKQDQIMSFMEVSEIHENSERLRKINAYLLEQFKKSKMTIEEGIIEEEYQELIQTFTTIIHVDVVPPLLRLLRPIDFLYHGAGVSKRRVGINVLTQKHVLLLISDLENIEKELYILESLYTEAWQQSFEILWVPVQDFWTEADDAKFEALHMNMRWYVLGEPRKLRRAAIRFVREWWGFKNRPILVALDPKGQVMSTNAFPMVWIWQPFAHPFTTARERDLWSEQEWNLEFLIDGTDPHSLNQLVDGKYICLYGGEDMQWIKNFTSLWRNVAKAANIQLEMVYVGKRNPKNGIQPIINTIREENLSHTLPDLFQIWFFWTRVESMWESKQRMLKAHGIKGREGFKEEEKDLVLQEVVAMLGYGGEGDGWGLVSKASDMMVRAKGNLFSRGLAEFNEWEVNIPTKGFLTALNDHLLMRLPPHHCTRFMLPETAGIIPNEVECTECRRTMEKYYLYQCCLE